MPSSKDFQLRRQAIAATLQGFLGRLAHQKTLAAKAGVDPTALSEYLSCKRTAGEPQLRKLAKGLDVSWVELWEQIGREQVQIARREEGNSADEVREKASARRPSGETREPARGPLEQALRSIMVDALREVLPPLLDRELQDRGLDRIPDSRKPSS